MADEQAGPNIDARATQFDAKEQSPRGKLHIYLGAAPGVGKTYVMLEARRRKQQGTDVVVGFVETYGRPHTVSQLDGLEEVPPREGYHSRKPITRSRQRSQHGQRACPP